MTEHPRHEFRHHDDHRDDHDDDHHDHAAMALAPFGARRPIHRIGRRQFLTDLGRGTFAVAVLGGLAACSSDSSDGSPTTRPRGNEPAGGDASVDDAAELRWSQVALGNVSAYVLVRGNRAAVVDTGNPGSVDRIGEALGTLGVTYDDVAHVVLTHRHPDHIGSLPAVLERAPSAAAYAGADDIPHIESPAEITAVGDGDDVFGLEVVETPGHTPGSISVLDTGIGLLIAGDALNGNADGTGISGANPRFTDDMDLAAASIRKLAGFEFETAAFGHGNPMVGGASSLVRALAEGS